MDISIALTVFSFVWVLGFALIIAREELLRRGSIVAGEILDVEEGTWDRRGGPVRVMQIRYRFVTPAGQVVTASATKASSIEPGVELPPAPAPGTLVLVQCGNRFAYSMV